MKSNQVPKKQKTFFIDCFNQKMGKEGQRENRNFFFIELFHTLQFLYILF